MRDGRSLAPLGGWQCAGVWGREGSWFCGGKKPFAPAKDMAPHFGLALVGGSGGESVYEVFVRADGFGAGSLGLELVRAVQLAEPEFEFVAESSPEG